MAISDVIIATKEALQMMNKKFCALSQIDYSLVDERVREPARKSKYLERPFAYEFYHQIRRLMDEGIVDFGGPIIQAEVDKTYQHCFEEGKIPDFIIHIQSTTQNLAVIEFKLATNLSRIEEDLAKLVEFKTNEDLRYIHGVEVILGDTDSLEAASKRIDQMSTSEGEEIAIVYFNTDSWEANHLCLKYMHASMHSN